MKNTKKIAAAALLLLTITSCGGASSSNNSETTVAVSNQFNDDDVMFAQMMIPHHEQAIELADMALDPTVMAGEDVKRLATQIKAAQDPEIQTMTQLLTTWKKSLTMDDSMDHGDMMSGMLTQDDLTQLSGLRGSEFDEQWILAMIAHHEGAIEMALAVLQDGENPAVLGLADAIIKGQEAEIEEMKTLVK